MSISAIFLIAFGGALAFEGAVWAIFPGGLRRAYREFLEQADERDLHITGAISVFVGVCLLLFGVSLLS